MHKAGSHSQWGEGVGCRDSIEGRGPSVWVAG